jgi:alpha-beta hydrolase superfamily lysophospholipase
MSHFEFERKATDGLDLFFQGWQTEHPHKGVICLVHGLGEHSGRYTPWADWLNEAGYSVLSFDLRGHGRSGGLRGHVMNFDYYFRDTDLLLDEAKNRYSDSPCFLYGHSLGAIIICDYVLHRKPRLYGVVLTAIAIKTPLQDQKGKLLLSKALGAIYPKLSLDSGLDPTTISKDAKIVSDYVNDPLVHHKITVGFGNSSISAIDYINTHASEWTLPVLLMHGEADKLGYAEGSRDLARMIKGDCTLKIWPGLVHEIHNEPEKQQVFEYLRQWLDNHINA